MSDYTNLGDSLEGKKVRLETRKQLFKNTIIDSNLGTLYKFKCSIRSEAEITCELSPKKNQYHEKSHLDLGDCLKADSIEVYSKKNLKFDIISGATSTHKAQTVETNCYTYAQISVPFRFILEKLLKDE